MRNPTLLAAFLLMTASASHAHAADAWLHTCPAAAVPADVRKEAVAKATDADGKPVAWFVDAVASRPGCRNVALALPPGSQVDTLYPLAPGETPAATILLLGDAGEGRFAPSEHELPAPAPAAQGDAAPATRVPMPLHANLLPDMHARAFGAEERAQVRLADGRLTLTCRAGQRAAGVVLSGPWYLPRANVVLAARGVGAGNSGGGGFAWQVADAARAARDDALDMDVVVPGGKVAARMALPRNLERADWRHFVVLCPKTAGSLEIDELALQAAAAPGSSVRATWVWRPGDWIDNGPALLDWAAQQGLGTLFVTVPLKDGAAVRAPDLLADFVRAARKRGVHVYSVDGDPHMVLADELPAVVKRAQAYAAYNAAAEPDARLAGMQFDVEPYLLPDSVLPPGARDARYLAMARALKDVATASGTLKLEFVVPFWWDGKQELLDGLAPYADALTVMDYRTDPRQLVEFAVPFLDWGERHGRLTRIALEAGAIDPQTQRRYVRAAPGETADLVATDVDGRKILALLRAPVRVTAAPSGTTLYRLAGSRVLDGSATTFHADKAAVLHLLPYLETTFGAWPSFLGIAVHELR